MTARVTHVVGARPNFMKAAPVIRALGETERLEQAIVHTGQHYDSLMSDLFFRQLALPEPDVNLGVGSGSHARQTADVMIGLETYLQANPTELLVVYGDINSTMAAALVAAKGGIRLAHVEAGLRSFDRSMPEEINRMVTDRLADLLLTPSADGDENLLREGAAPSSIHRVGNVMIDTLVRSLPLTEPDRVLATVGLAADEPFCLVTLHRPASVDDPDVLRGLVEGLLELSREIQIVFPVHPRTRARMQPQWTEGRRLKLIDPIGYLEFLALERVARIVITDSGGVQEETTFLGIPCITVRENTERPVTVTAGTNVVVGRDPSRMLSAARRALSAPAGARRSPPDLWDGHAGVRIAQVIRRELGLT